MSNNYMNISYSKPTFFYASGGASKNRKPRQKVRLINKSFRYHLRGKKAEQNEHKG